MRTKHSGFTLIEVLVISPIVLLFVGTFIALLVNLTGESLVIRERNVAIYDSQSALDDLQGSINQATGFLTTTGTLQSPQGKGNSTAAFTDTNTDPLLDSLILKLAATTKSPNDSTRSLIYTGTGACDSKNPIYTYFVVYHIDSDPDTNDTTDKALYKRTILPLTAACETPWQRGSCERTLVAGNPSVCKTSDEKLVGGITTFDVSYFAGTSSATAATATDASVNLVVGKQVAGSPVNYSSSARATSLNMQSSDASSTTPPANPTPTATRTTTNPYRTTIAWGRVGNASGGYTAKYSIGGAAAQSVSIPQVAVGQTPSFPIDASHRKQTISVSELKVVTSAGTFDYGSVPTGISAIPNWNECQFSGQGAWANYGDYYPGGPYTRAGFTKTSSKLVGLKGLVKGTTLNVPICNLPVGFRPKFAGEKLIFQVASGNGANWGRIDVYANGDVVPVQGNTEWFSLDGIIFAADDSNYTWTTLSWQNGWGNYNTMYGGGHATLRTTVDSEGRRHVQGLGGYSGTAPNSVPMTYPGSTSNRVLHYPAMSGNPGIVQTSSDGAIRTRSSPNTYQSLQLIYRLAGATGWQNMPFSSGWTNYDVNNWPTMQCHRGSDDVVIVQGLIAHPGGGNGTYIGDTGPCGALASPDGLNRMILSPWLSNETTGRIDMINGVSLLSQGTQDPWTALDGIHFIAN